MNKDQEDERIICEECSSELIVDLRKCPICGNIISGELVGISQEEKRLKKRLTQIYNLIFWAEELEVDTLDSYKLVSEARDEFEIGDVDETERLLDEAFDSLFDPLVKAAEKDLDNFYDNIEKYDTTEDEIFKLAGLLEHSIEKRKEGNLDDALSIIFCFRERLDSYRSV